jgi:tRNA (guanine-N7-)-methyltransferase
MKERRRIEREFGVPIAGEILDPSAWTKTALKKLPTEGYLSWPEIFNRTAPVVLDIGCGNGRYTIGSAVWRPQYDHLGSDILPVVIRYATRRGNQRGLRNIRFAVVDGQSLLERLIAPGSVMEIHCYHPQPFDEPPQPARRMITSEFLGLVERALAPGGLFYVQSDHPGYWDEIRRLASSVFDFQERDTPWPDAPKGRTRREIIALRRRLTVFRGIGIKGARR